MRIAILGVGGVGGYIGARLKLSGKDEITFITRGRQLETIKKNGLKLIDENEEYIVKPDFITDNPKDLGIFDFIIIAVKSYDLRHALELINSNVSRKTILLPLLNGVSHDKEIKEIYKEAKVLNGCIYILSNIKSPGIIKKYGGVFNLIFGTTEFSLESLAGIKKLFDNAKLKNRLTDDIEFETWKKYLLISAYASLTSYYKKPMGYIVQNHLEELREVLIEIKNVANEKGIPLKNKNIEKIILQAKNIPYDSKTSMQLDFEKGKKTELEALCGYIVKEAKNLNITIPIMKKIYLQLK